MPPPEHYSGALGSCSFDLQPSSYASDKSRIAYTMNLLRGRAAQWGTALWEGSSSTLNSYASFVEEMKKVFDHPVEGSVAASRLFTLRQGSQSAAEYSIEFRILAAEAGWNEPVLINSFNVDCLRVYKMS